MTPVIRAVDPAASPHFGGEVSGIDLRQPCSADTIAEIERGMDRFGVLVFRNQPIDDEQQLAFSRCFGTLEQASGDLQQGSQRRLSMDFNDISNVDQDNKVLDSRDRRRLFSIGNRLWHSDSSFKAIPAKYSLLSARVLPPNGPDTEFADMRAAYDALDEGTRALVEPLICEHSQLYSRGSLGFADFTAEEIRKFAPVRQPLVRRHPVTGRKSLFLSSHAGAIIGMPMPEARALLRDLTEDATQRPNVHAHHWQPHDLVVWDNRVTMHRVRRYSGPSVRDMRRTTIAGVALLPQNATLAAAVAG